MLLNKIARQALLAETRSKMDEVSPVFMAMGAQSLLKAATPPAHAPASEADVERGKKEREDAAKEVLEILGFVPGAWGMLSLATLSINALSKGSIIEGVIGLIFCIPEVGPILKRMGITPEEVVQAGKIPAEMAEVVASHADEIEDAISRLEDVIPNSEQVKKAVDELISRCRVGEDVDLFSLQVRDATARPAQLQGFAKELISDPRWKKWAVDIARPAITDVLNDAVTKEFRQRVIGGLTYGMDLDVRAQVMSEAQALASTERVLEIAREELPKIVDEIAKGLKSVNFILDPEVAVQTSRMGSKGLGVLGHVTKDTAGNPIINIFLPRHLTSGEAKAHIVNEIRETVSHELDHFVDQRLHAAFARAGVAANEFWFLSNTSTRLVGALTDLAKEIDMSVTDDAFLREMLVNVRSFRRGMKQKMFTAFDIEAIATGAVPEEIANTMSGEGINIYTGIQRRYALLKKIAPQVGMSEKDPRFIRQYIEPFYKKTADLLNRIP